MGGGIGKTWGLLSGGFGLGLGLGHRFGGTTAGWGVWVGVEGGRGSWDEVSWGSSRVLDDRPTCAMHRLSIS